MDLLDTAVSAKPYPCNPSNHVTYACPVLIYFPSMSGLHHTVPWEHVND